VKIDTEAVRRLRDALLLHGRRELDVVSSAFQTLARNGLLSDGERAAIARVDPMAEMMFLVLAADDRFTPAERDALRGAIRTLVGDTLANGTIDFMLREYAQLLARDGREERLRSVAHSLKRSPEDAEGAFALAAAIAIADDHVAPSEKELIRRFADWLEMSEERAAAILRDLSS
jgi:tellurite resistance protein